MYGAGIGALKVYKQDFFNKQRTLAFSLSGNQGNAWHQASVNFVSDHEYTVIFEGVYGGNYTGDIAIDDVLISASPCSATTPTPAISMATTPAVFPKTAVDCDFETGLCSWNQDVGDDFNWSIKNGTTSSGNTGPTADHTLQNNLGHYIYIEVSGKLPNTTARLISPSVYVQSAGVCLKFWYNMYGAQINNLNLYVQNVSSTKKQMLWNKHGSQGTDWKYAQVHLQSQGQVKFVFEGVAGVSYQGDIALDDISLNQGLCPGSPTCDFEDGMCGYTQDVSDQFDWTLHSSRTVSTSTGPVSDHTYGTAQGHYVYIEASAPRRMGDKARIDSPSFPATTGTGSCLTFWYSMYGRSIGSLNVYLRQGTSSQLRTPIWTLSGNQGSRWRIAQTTINSPTSFRLTFEGTVGSGYQGDIAIDDINLVSGACPPPGSCDFEKNLCTWTNVQGNDTFDWERHKGRTASFGTGPSTDHTLKTIYGSYMYIEASAPRKHGDKAWLASQTFESSKTPIRCVTFWYNMYGSGIGTLNVYQYFFASTPKPVFTLSGSQGQGWKQGSAELTSTTGQDYQVLIEGVVGSIMGDIAIDDISVTSGHCTTPTVNPTCPFRCSNGQCLKSINNVCDFNSDCPNGEDESNCGFNCDFEQNHPTCKWNSTSSGFQWMTSSGSSSSQNTNKPSTDHTTLGPNGNYMYVAPKAGVYRRLADLTSPVIGQSSSTCQLSFWYHMRGRQILRVYLKELSGFTRTQIFYLYGDQGNVWKQAIVPIGRVHSRFQIIISGQRTYSGVGDIAVDDINFQGCAFPTSTSCSSFVTFKCASGACVNQNRVCDYSDDCGDNTDEANSTCAGYNRCNFENGLCDWTQLTDDDLDWTLRAGPTPSASTGPTKDHTLNTNTGHYLYLETSRPVRQGQKARIASTAFQQSTSQPYCQFRFFYFMYGNTVDTLTVYYRNQINGPLFKVFSVHGNVGSYYARQVVNIRSSSPFQVVIEATAGANYLSDIAIDDVSFSSNCQVYYGNLPMGTPATTVPTSPGPCSGGHQCGDSSCVAQNQVCDFVPQCSDGSDEAACGQCNFEKSSCGWTPIPGGRYAWKRHNSSTPTSFNTPQNDHTYGTTQVGNYMFIDASSGSYATDTRLVSPVYGNLSSTCSISFAYYTNVGPFSRLNLYLYPPNSDPTTANSRVFYRLWTSSSLVGSQWQNATVGIGNRNPGYRLAFVARNFDRNRGGIAIDDVVFNTCALPAVGQCASNQFKCHRGACVDMTRKCDFSNDCGDNSDEIGCSSYVERCNFESDICNWQQDINDMFDWTWKQGATASSGTGPNFDHTYGNSTGHYVFIETSAPRVAGDKARLLSPVFQANSQAGQCQMRFFYHMHGQDVNALNVYIENYEMGPRIPVFQKTGSQADMWIRAMIDLTSNLPFRVVIEGIRGKGYHGDIAIDDMSFTSGCKLATSYHLPQALTTIGPCGAGKGQCNNGQCIKYNMFCDFKTDCSDGSDEQSCPSTCNFDNGQFCNWQNDLNTNTLNWTIGSNNNPSPSPTTDHTTGSVAGKFALIQSQSTTTSRKIARLESPMYYQAGTACTFTMWYNTNGTGIQHLGVYFTQGESYRNIWTMTGTQLRTTQRVWTKATVELPKCPMNFKVTIEVATYGRQTNYVAIDDLAFTQCHYLPPTSSCLLGQFTCSSGNCVPQNLKCDLQTDCCDGSDESRNTCAGYQQCNFEYGVCGWQQSTTDQFDWLRHQGPTNSYGTGPSGDHTYGSRTGYYMYIESSRPRRANDTAQLIYNLNVPTSPCAMRLWYHMYGQNVGQLNIYIKTLNKGTVLLKSISSNQNQTWHRLEVGLQSTTPYQVVIEGVIGVGYLGDIAIDDVSFTPGCGASSSGGAFTTPAVSTPSPNTCGEGQFACGDSTCIPLSKVCNFQSDCKDNSDENQCPQTCNFEQDTCGWHELPLDQFDWTRANGLSTSSKRNMAPNIDDTYKNQNGYYMYVNDQTSGQTSGLIAGLQSSAFKSANADCKISFAYYTTGSKVGPLYLFVVENNVLTPLWRLLSYGTMDDQWHSVTVGIGRRTTNFNMLFRKTISSYSGITAIDDISFTDCRMRPPVTQCNTVTHFWCSNKVCIPKSKQCDNVDDCGDGSDEGSVTCNGYTRYNFEVGTGNLIQGQNGVDDDFDWSLFAGHTPSSFTGPQWDHTYGNSTGHYLYMEASKQKYNSKAWILTTPFYRTNGRNCVMRLYYFMYGIYVNQLNVYSRMYSSGPPTHTLFSRSGEQGAYWQEVILPLNYSTDFQIIIEAKVGDNFLGDIAIDDISFTPDCQASSNNLLESPWVPIAPRY
ncbi:MAM and LDL-receptor class A domain-containing protein 2-like [Saccostrea echinata]|uniref:MAM and LDL-receptor class A domain-containing protein 2-like n=1 Tax=Saccostrea echinata TaxID=191078 RepID=UPI002A826D9C|nr:MAM and LDL-receptor class A domain-containing protein 2-like [Saccostrea echinata]